MAQETEALWAGRVAAWRASGLTSTDFCEGREFSAGGLRHWACRLRKASSPPRKGAAALVRLARVVLPRASVAPVRSADTPATTEATAVLLQLGAVQVAVRRVFDRDTLAAVLDVLDARGRR